MPALDQNSRDSMLGPQTVICTKCETHISRNYCRQCDEFFFECDCTRAGTQLHGHEGHRVYRISEPPEEVEMRAHEGRCKYCNAFTVKMRRGRDAAELLPDQCYCFLCGQRYYVTITTSVAEWEAAQWREKAESGR